MNQEGKNPNKYHCGKNSPTRGKKRFAKVSKISAYEGKKNTKKEAKDPTKFH
jgi:hypothetical protein